MKFYAIAVGFNKEKKEPVYNTISIDWDETRSLVQGVSKKKDNIQTFYKSCGSLKEAEEYLDGALPEALEVQAFETPALEELLNKRIYPENFEPTETKQKKKEKVEHVKETIEQAEKEIVISVEDVNTVIEESPEVIDNVIVKEEEEEEEKPVVKDNDELEEDDESEIITVPEKPLDETEEIIEESVVKIDRDIPVYKENTPEPKKQKDSIDLYMINTYRSYDEKTNYIAYGYTITKNGVTLKSDSYIEKSKEPTIDGANLLGTMYAIEQGAEELKRLVSEDENLVVMVGHLEKHLEPSIIDEIQPDNGEYFFDWLKLYYAQNEHIKLMFDTIIVKYPEKNYIKLQVDVKKLLKSKSK